LAVIPAAPGFAAIDGDDRALIADDENRFRIMGLIQMFW